MDYFFIDLNEKQADQGTMGCGVVSKSSMGSFASKVGATRNKQTNFSAYEDKVLCKSWLEISCVIISYVKDVWLNLQFSSVLYMSISGIFKSEFECLNLNFWNVLSTSMFFYFFNLTIIWDSCGYTVLESAYHLIYHMICGLMQKNELSSELWIEVSSTSTGLSMLPEFSL